MGLEDAPEVMGLYTRYISPTYDTFNQRLTPARAALLDYLTNLVGPAALQQWLGTATDPAAMNTTAFAALQRIEQIICDIEAQIKQLSAAQITNTTTTVYTVNTITPDPGNPAALTGCGTTAPVVIFDPTSAWGFSPFGPGSGTAFTGGGLGQLQTTDGVSYSTNCATGTVTYSLNKIGEQQIPQTTVTTNTTVVSLFPGFSFSPIGGCSGNSAGALQVTAHGFVPNGSADIFLWRLGGDTQPYVGVKRISGSYYFIASNGSNVTQVAIPSGGTGNVPNYPHVLVWDPTHGGVLTLNSGTQLTITPANMPPQSEALPAHFESNCGLTSLAVGYI